MQYSLSEMPEPGTFVEVEAGIYCVRLPLPIALDHINVWLLDDGDGWTLVDSGICMPETKQAWEEIFNAVQEDKPFKRLIVTHHHPDHFGLAKWLCDRFSIDLYMTSPAYKRAAKFLEHGSEESLQHSREFFRANGAAEPSYLASFTSGHIYRKIVSGMPAHTHIIEAGSELRIGRHSWETIISNGHAEGHLSLYCRRSGLLISGDQVLPDITSNISLFEDDPDLDPLREYLDSLREFRKLPGDTMVLPSHGGIFTGLHERLDVIEKGHVERSETVYGLCEELSTVSDVARKLFPRRLDDINTCLAFGETFSHLRYLVKKKRIQCINENERFLYQKN